MKVLSIFSFLINRLEMKSHGLAPKSPKGDFTLAQLTFGISHVFYLLKQAYY